MSSPKQHKVINGLINKLLGTRKQESCCISISMLADGIFTTRKRSLGQGNIFTPVCHSVHRGEYLGRDFPPWAGALPGPGTPPWDQVHPLDQVHPPGPGTPPRDQVPPFRAGTPPPGAVSGRYASYWNAFLFPMRRKYLPFLQYNDSQY